MDFLKNLFSRPLVGLDIGVSGIKAVELSGTKNPRLMAYNRIPLPLDVISQDGEIRSRESVVKALKRLFETKNFSTKRVAVGAFGNAVITKKISVPRMSAKELNHQLYWEAEQYIPFNIEEVNLDFAILGNTAQTAGTTPMMDVLLVAAKKDYIGLMSALLEDAGLVPDVIDNQTFALGNSFEFNYGYMLGKNDPGEVNIIIDFGAGTTKLSVVERDKTTFTRELRQSGNGCTQLIAERLGVSFEEAETMKLEGKDVPEIQTIIEEFNSLLIDELLRTIDFFMSQSNERVIHGVYICGGASKTFGLFESLVQRMPTKVETLNPIQNIAGSGQKMNPKAIKELSYLGAVAIGLSLRTAGDAA